jgi:hypothetical protein
MNKVTTMFGGEERTFAFNLNEIEELQRLSGNVGLGTIIKRVMENEFWHSDIYQTIRLGLIGGGEVAPTRAKELCDTYIVGKPLAAPGDPSSPLSVTKVILGNIMFGVAEDKEPKKDSPGAMTGSSTSQQSEQPPSGPASTLSASEA